MSFPLGRPLGNPNDPEFQCDVIRWALNLLTEPEGPVLADYPHDAEDADAPPALPACPVDFSPRRQLNETETLFHRLHTEFSSMHTWYTVARARTGRTAAGISGLDFDEIIELYRDFISGNHPGLERFAPHLPDTLRLAAEDLKSCYFEALSSQPDQPTDAASLSNWFWENTYAAAAINEVRKKCLDYTTKEMQLAGNLLLVPRNQLHRFTP